MSHALRPMPLDQLVIRLMEKIKGENFYGEIRLIVEGSQIHRVKIEQNLKEDGLRRLINL